MGKSYSFSETKDQKLGVEGDIAGQVVMPEGQLANPLGINIDDSSGARVEYGDVVYTINEYPEELNSLITDILTQSAQTNQKTVDTISATTANLAEVIQGKETPLSQYIPYAVIAVVAMLVIRKWK